MIESTLKTCHHNDDLCLNDVCALINLFCRCDMNIDASLIAFWSRHCWKWPKVRSREDSQPRDWVLKYSHPIEIWLASREYCYRDTFHMSWSFLGMETHSALVVRSGGNHPSSADSIHKGLIGGCVLCSGLEQAVEQTTNLAVMCR